MFEKNILVTGANGLVGSHMVKRLCQKASKQERVIATALHRKKLAHLQDVEQPIWAYGDITNPAFIKSLVSRNQVSEIFHFAASAVVKTAYKNPFDTIHTNVMGMAFVLDAAREFKVPRVTFLQTDKYYGERMAAMEMDPPSASEPYSASKICQHFLAETYEKTYGMKICEVRSCNIYGYDPYSDRLVPNVVKSCIMGEDPVVWYDDQTVRQYIHVEDVISGLQYISEHDLTGAYNICDSGAYNQGQIIGWILKHFPERTPKYEKMPKYYQVQLESMVMKEFGWYPQIPISEGIESTCREFEYLGWK